MSGGARPKGVLRIGKGWGDSPFEEGTPFHPGAWPSGVGKSEVWASNLARNQFFQERVVAILSERYREVMKAIFTPHRKTNRLRVIRNDR